jgi:hypothetical protein
MQSISSSRSINVQFNIWRKIRTPFVIPQSICDHPTNQWEVYDIDQAGCKLCGIHHICDISTCNTVTADEVRTFFRTFLICEPTLKPDYGTIR